MQSSPSGKPKNPPQQANILLVDDQQAKLLSYEVKTRELGRLNIELERRVAERTAALRQLNEDLEDRIEQRAHEREKALAQLLEARKAESIGEFTGEAAHDFNNLLMAVLGSLSLLAKRLPADPHSRRLIDIALQGGRRGAALAQRLLAFSRRQELKPEPVNIGELVSGMQGLLKRAVGMSIELDCQLPGALTPVLVDANQLELVLLNVALNARDAMPAGGRLSISAGEVGDAEVEHSPLPPGGYMRIKLADTGVGMDEATRVKAVEPFFTTKHPSLGGGLGLSVAQGIAAQSGGLLCIESAPNSGTAVEVWLPQFKDASRPSKDLRVIAARIALQSASNDVFPGN